MKLNLNDRVKVKLSPKGIAILQQEYPTMKVPLKIDEEGYYSDQLWCLFSVFGPYINLGCVMPFETGIIIIQDQYL
jgi:hypothetical protein